MSNMPNFKEVIQTKDYDFLQTNPHLGENIALLGLGGSYAYGTNVETSDVDIRGIATNTADELLTNDDFEQVTHKATDTTIYSINKMIGLLSNCNPNVIEILGLKPEQYLYINPFGQYLLNHKHLFLSKTAVHSFGGYANSQLRRLDNKAVRTVEQARQEAHILNSMRHAIDALPEGMRVYIDKAETPDLDDEIYFDANLTHYSLRKFHGHMSDLQNVLRDYYKLGTRNQKAIEHAKLGKHMMHLVRLYLMCMDILLKEEINTYRDDPEEHKLLMSIREGAFLDENQQPIPEFEKLVDSLSDRLDYAKEHTHLPERVDINKIKQLKKNINLAIITKDLNYLTPIA